MTKYDPRVVGDNVPKGALCLHNRMRECHPGCGHYKCPDCGLTWDESAEGDPEYDEARARRAGKGKR